MKHLYVAVAAALLAATPAMATDDGGFYVGAGLGIFSVDESSFSESDTGFKLFGGWMFNQFVGGELEYIDGGTVREGNFGIDSTGLNASLKGNWPINEQFDVFGKVGYFFWDAEFDAASDLDDLVDNGDDPFYGAGLRINFGKFSILGEYEKFDSDELSNDLFSLGMRFTF